MKQEELKPEIIILINKTLSQYCSADSTEELRLARAYCMGKLDMLIELGIADGNDIDIFRNYTQESYNKYMNELN